MLGEGGRSGGGGWPGIVRGHPHKQSFFSQNVWRLHVLLVCIKRRQRRSVFQIRHSLVVFRRRISSSLSPRFSSRLALSLSGSLQRKFVLILLQFSSRGSNSRQFLLRIFQILAFRVSNLSVSLSLSDEELVTSFRIQQFVCNFFFF